jgi:hypothetical protein
MEAKTPSVPSARHSRTARVGTDRSSAYSQQAAEALHLAICAKLAIEAEYNMSTVVRSEIARVLGIRVQRYTEAIKGTRGSLPSICRWITLWNESAERKKREVGKLYLIWDGTQFKVRGYRE